MEEHERDEQDEYRVGEDEAESEPKAESERPDEPTEEVEAAGPAELDWVAEPLPSDGRELPPHLKLFEGQNPSEVLRKITVGDPLGMEGIAATRVYERAVLVDPERVTYRSLARLAFDAMIEEDVGEPTLQTWILARVDKAIRELIEEDVGELRQALPPDPDDDYSATIARAFKIEPELTKAACTNFNHLEEKTRRVFFKTVLEKEALVDCVVQGLGSMEEVKERLDIALRVLMAPELYPEDGGLW